MAWRKNSAFKSTFAKDPGLASSIHIRQLQLLVTVVSGLPTPSSSFL